VTATGYTLTQKRFWCKISVPPLTRTTYVLVLEAQDSLEAVRLCCTLIPMARIIDVREESKINANTQTTK
jgi:hypothetical protein